jgi:hypothetical protein
MAKSLISIGSTSNDGTGDTLRAGAEKINANFDEIYSTFGNGTSLSSSVSNAATSSYASVAGIATIAQGLSGAPNITAGIVTTSGNLNVVGIVTSSGATIYNTTTLTSVSVSGVTTFSGSGNNINQSAGTAAINRLVVSGITTSGVGNTATLGTNSTMQFFLQNDTTLRVAVRGSDGVTRYGTISLA